jgi:hypothetical protein
MYKITEFYTEWFSVCQNFALSPYLKASSYKIIIQIKLVDMFTISYRTKITFFFSEWNGPGVVSIKQNSNFKFQPLSTFVILVSHIYLRRSNDSHFGMVNAKVMHRGFLHAECFERLPTASKPSNGDAQTHGQTDVQHNHISHTLLFKESVLKVEMMEANPLT